MEVSRRLKHPKAVFGLAWAPSNKWMLATGCNDFLIRIYDMNNAKGSARRLEGHSGSVHCVAWHPHFEHVLASGGDDCAIRVWDVREVFARAKVGRAEEAGGTQGKRARTGLE